MKLSITSWLDNSCQRVALRLANLRLAVLRATLKAFMGFCAQIVRRARNLLVCKATRQSKRAHKGDDGETLGP